MGRSSPRSASTAIIGWPPQRKSSDPAGARTTTTSVESVELRKRAPGFTSIRPSCIICTVAYEFGLVTTDEERRAVQRLRYDVYVDEMGRYKARADHKNRLFPEPEDETGWLFYARDGDDYVGTTRLSWGG